MASPEQQQVDARDPRSYLCPTMPPIPGYNLEFRFSSNPQTEHISNIEWEAELLVQTKDLPCLMKHGFHWNEANVQEGEGYFGGREISSSRSHHASWWRCARVYLLKDKAEDPQWDAVLSVYAREIPILSAFKIAHLSVNKIDYTAAWDQNGRYVYHFCAMRENLNFNAYYDDRPLQGWWPWPKQEESSVVKSESEQEEWDKGWLGGEEGLM